LQSGVSLNTLCHFGTVAVRPQSERRPSGSGSSAAGKPGKQRGWGSLEGGSDTGDVQECRAEKNDATDCLQQAN